MYLDPQTKHLSGVIGEIDTPKDMVEVRATERSEEVPKRSVGESIKLVDKSCLFAGI